MAIQHFITFHNQTKHSITLTRPNETAAIRICSCWDTWGPGIINIPAGGTRLIALEDNDGIGHCDGGPKVISWEASDRYIPVGGSHNYNIPWLIRYGTFDSKRYGGWAAMVSGPIVFADVGGNSCTSPCWVGRPDILMVNIYL